MAWRIPDDAINALRDRVNIVEIVSTYVSLKRAGRNWLGLCPFHAEKTPSFTVNEERGLFHCFGCGAGGSVFTFLMQQERLEFREAVEMLAKRVGFVLPAPEGEGRAAGDRERLVRLNAWAAKQFRESLWGRDGQQARDYLRQRGVSDEVARTFDLGYAPPLGDFLARRLGPKTAAVAAAARLGLLLQREGGGIYDRFRHRLLFPIADARGAIIAFGGRALGDAQPKYLNSPESQLFRKSDVLYALPQARDEMRKRDEAIVVEGYLDALSLIQFGVGNAVATLGTALTPAHLRLLRRISQRIVVFFDGDDAGRKAALRGFGVCTEAGVWAHAAFLPQGEDPDSFVRRTGGPEAVRELLARAVPLSDFYFDTLLASTGSGLRERADAAQDTARLIALARDPIERDVLIRAAAQRLSVSEEALRAAMRRAPVRAGSAPPLPAPPPDTLEPRAEVLLLEAMAVEEGAAQAVRQRGTIERFLNPELAECARQIAGSWERSSDIARAIETMPSAIAARLSGALLAAVSEEEPGDRLRLAEDCIRRIEADADRPQYEAARREVSAAAAAHDTDRERESLRRMQERLRERKVKG